MFLTKEDFEESIDMMEAYINITTESDIKASEAEKYARKIFDDFDSLIEDNKKQIIEMIIEDIHTNLYNIN